MQQPAATDAELVGALTRRRLGLPPPPSQPFTVHDDVLIFHFHPSDLYDKYGGGGATSLGGDVYFFSNQIHLRPRRLEGGLRDSADLDGGSSEVSWKDTLVFHERRWLPKTRWAMDEFRADYQKYSDWLCLYRLHRLEG